MTLWLYVTDGVEAWFTERKLLNLTVKKKRKI
jgi:hypothetical protein